MRELPTCKFVHGGSLRGATECACFVSDAGASGFGARDAEKLGTDHGPCGSRFGSIRFTRLGW
jgi:hypothetical protein